MDAIGGRNGICHHNLPEVLKDWKRFLESWVQVCLLIGSNQTASKIKRVIRFLKNSRIIPDGLKSTSLPSPPLETSKDTQPTSQWTTTKEEASAFLGNVLYFDQIHRNSSISTSVIDFHEMTKMIKNKCCSNDFQTPHDGNKNGDKKKPIKTKKANAVFNSTKI